MNSGFHRVDIILFRVNKTNSYKMKEAIGFDVIDNTERKYAWFGREGGVLFPDLPWETKFLGS